MKMDMFVKRGLLFLFVFPTMLFGQICNPNGNLVIFTNYDGGFLNIDVDVNIPNLKIGIVSYEAVQVTFSGAFVGNISEVRYAGYNANNNHCGALIGNTTITNAPVGAQVSVVFAPQATLSNPNGNGSIICGYSCNTSGSQGGCNTVDQVEHYFLNTISGSVLHSHLVQYGCWQGTKAISTGGTCCPVAPPPPPPLVLNASSSAVLCKGDCNGTATVIPTGGTPPYSYQWLGLGLTSQTATNVCEGTYTVIVTDALSLSAQMQVSVSAPPVLVASIALVMPILCFGDSAQVLIGATGGTTPHFGVGNAILGAGNHTISVNDANGCTASVSTSIVSPQSLMLNFSSGNEFFGCDGYIAAQVSGGTVPYTYVWDSASGNQSADSAIALCPGSYCVTISDANGCTIQGCDSVSPSTVGYSNLLQNQSTFSIFPNPSLGGKSTLSMYTEYRGMSNIVLRDMCGRILWHKEIRLEADVTSFLIEAPGQGVFVLEMVQEGWRVATLWVNP